MVFKPYCAREFFQGDVFTTSLRGSSYDNIAHNDPRCDLRFKVLVDIVRRSKGRFYPVFKDVMLYERAAFILHLFFFFFFLFFVFCNPPASLHT